MRDVYPITVLVGYQFAMRWMNAHIFYVKKGSPLSRRILDITRTMPLNHPEFTTVIVDKVCLSLFIHVKLWKICMLTIVRNAYPVRRSIYPSRSVEGQLPLRCC